MDFVWLEYPETGGKQQFAAESAEMWRARGWVDTDPPAEPDMTKDPLPDADPDVAQPQQDADDPAPTETPGADVAPPKTTRAKTRASDSNGEK